MNIYYCDHKIKKIVLLYKQMLKIDKTILESTQGHS